MGLKLECSYGEEKSMPVGQGRGGLVFLGLARLVFILSLLSSLPIHSEPASEVSPAPSSSSSVSGEGSGGGGKELESLNTGAFVNSFTGQPSFTIPLTMVSNHGGISFPIGFGYFGGGLEHRSASQPKYNPTSWVGEGFNFSAPSISSNPKGSLSLEGDEYSISLDGSSFVPLIPEIGNPDILYPSNNPNVKVQRMRRSVSMISADPYSSMNGPPTSVPPQNADHVVGWTVTLQNGVAYRFGSGSAACDDGNNYSYCIPVVGDKLGYQPFYNFGTGENTSRFPVQWYLREIRSMDNRFSIFLEYEKNAPPVTGIAYATGGPPSPSVPADRAIYLKKVYSVNGSLTSDAKITTVVLDRGFRNPADFFDNSLVDPLARFETERLSSISTFIRDNTSPEVTYHFDYTPDSEYSRNQLKEIREARGIRERRLYTFNYDTAAGAPWRLKKVKPPTGLEWTYSYAPPAGLFALDPQVLDLKTLTFGGTAHNPLADYEKPKIFMHQEIGSKLYVGIEEGSACPPPPLGEKWKKRVVELENFGTHWAVQRVFKAPQASCSERSEIALAPDGNYLAWSVLSNVWIFALNPRIGQAGSIDLASPPPNMLLLSSSIRQNSAMQPALIPFENWLVAYDRSHKKSLTFFHKNSDGAWVQNDATGCASRPPLAIEQVMHEGISPTGRCLDWNPVREDGEIEVRAGSNFIAVKFNENNDFSYLEGSSIRLYSYQGGVLREFKDGLLKSRQQKLGSGALRMPSLVDDYGLADRDFIWDPDLDRENPEGGLRILDISVRGNLVGLVLGARNETQNAAYPRYLQVFCYDGLQLRYLYQTTLSGNNVNYYGAHTFLGENYFIYRDEIANNFKYFAFNPRTWGVSNPVNLPSFSLTTSFKVMDGYFHLENVTNRESSYKPAAVGPGMGAYQASANSGQLFRNDPAGGAPNRVTGLNPNPAPQSEYLYNVFQNGDRFLGIAQNASAGNAWTYVYGQFRFPVNQVQWLPVPPTVSGMTAILVSSGAMTMDQVVLTGSNCFTGVLRFHGDYKGALLNSASTLPSTVTRVEISTKGNQSSFADGSIQRLDIAYPGSPRMNYLGKTPNFSSTVVISADGKRKKTTNYIVDYSPRDPTLPPNSIFQGLESGTQYSNIAGSGTGLKPGDSRIQYRYRANSIVTGWDNTSPLKETIRVPFLTKSNQDRYYFDASRATETRFAMPAEKNGQPRITVSKIGSDYHVSVVRFLHEFGPSPFHSLPVQTAIYLFKGADPCSGTNPDDPCSNLTNFNWLIPSSGNPDAPVNATRATSSTVYTYTDQGKPLAQYSWRSKEAGFTGLMTLDGTTPATDYHIEGRWIKESEVRLRPADHPSVISKHDNPTVIDNRGTMTTHFYSGREGMPLATVKNASKSVCTFLDAEEEVSGTGRGAFGDWETEGVVTTEMAHTGTHSIKATSAFGPTTNVAFRRDANFWARGKGLLVSGWMFVPAANSNPNPAANVELRINAATLPMAGIDLLAEYKAAHSGAFPFNRWFKLERLITREELASIPFTETDASSNPLIRVWFGKANPASNAFPVYVDDLRIHPADAVMMSQTYDAARRTSSRSDAENNPVFLQYDAWGGVLSAKDDKGRLFSTTAYKRIED